MSEDKPLPCAFCGHEPLTDDPGSNRVFCATWDCWPMRAVKSVLIGDWNNMHEAIMAMRRKDFEAGWNQGFCKGNNFDSCRSASQDFDDYIKEQK